MKKSITTNAIFNVIRQSLQIIFPMVTFPYVSRILLPEGVGKVNFCSSVVSFFILIATLGINTYGTREAAKVRDDRNELSKISKEIFIVNTIFTVISYLLLFFCILFISKFQSVKLLLLIFSTQIFFTLLGMQWLYTALEDFDYIAIRTVIFQIISLIFLFLFVKTKEDYLIYAGIIVISSVGANICNFIHARRFIDFFSNISLVEITKHFKPIFLLCGMEIAISLYTVLDTIMIGFLSDEYNVGIYTAANRITRIVSGFITSVLAVLTPRLAYCYTNMKDKFYTLFELGIKFIILISIPSIIGLSLLSDSIVSLFAGIDFLDSSIVIKILSPIILMIGFSFLFNTEFFVIIKKEKIALISVIVGATLNMIFNTMFIPYFGAVGAAIGSLIAETSVTVIDFFYILKHKYVSFNKYFISSFQIILSSFIMGGIVFFSVRYIQVVYVKLIVGVSCGVLTYVIFLVLFRNSIFLELLTLIKMRKKNVK